MAIAAGPPRTIDAWARLGVVGLVASVCLVVAVVDPGGALVLALVSALLVTALLSTDFAVALLIFVGFTNAADILERYHSIPSIGQPLFLLVVAAIAIRSLREPRRDTESAIASPAASLLPIIVALALLQLASSWWAADPTRSITAAGDTVRDGLLALVVAAAIRDARGLRRAVWAIIAAGSAIATVAVYQYLTSSFGSNFGGFGRATIESIVGASDNYRLSGPFDDPNFFALVLLLVVPLAVDRALHEERVILRLIGLSATVICVLAVVFTFSRGGFIGLIAVGLFVLFRERPGAGILVAGAAVLIAVFAFAPPQYTARLQTIPQALPGSPLNAPTADESIRGRTSEVTVGFQMFEDHPALGVGAANYDNNYEQYARRLGLDPRREEREAHDLYAEIAAELGAVGLLVFGILVVTTGRRLRSARRMLAAPWNRDTRYLVGALGASLIAYLVTSIFLHAAYTRPVWLLVGLAWATPAIAARQRDGDPAAGESAPEQVAVVR